MDWPLQDNAHGKAAIRACSFSPEENDCGISIYPFSSGAYSSFSSLRLRANIRMHSIKNVKCGESMYIFPEKFTGMNAELMGFSDFQEICYSLQGLGECKVNSVRDSDFPDNFYSAEFSGKNGDFTIFMNCYSPVIGFKKKLSDKEFIDKPTIKSTLETLNDNFQIPDALSLNQDVNKAHQVNLTENEVKEIKSWLPASVGELLFCSYFD